MAEFWALLGTLLALPSVPGTFELLMLTVGGILLPQRSLPPPLRGRVGVGGEAPPLNLAQLSGLMAGGRIVIGVDTGLTHLAAALGRPTVAIFCGSDPTLTGVFAGARAVNLGSAGRPPGAGDVLDSCTRLLAA